MLLPVLVWPPSALMVLALVVLVLGIVYSSFKHGLNKGASQGEELTKTNYTSSGALGTKGVITTYQSSSELRR